tara:strand:- start:515 stop:1219 length:705 start_codon:yes stop_codon:yes gene_type:complete
MNKLGIIQPGRLGDLIICLPAAKYLADKGYEIYWPVFDKYVKMFKEVVEYVNFLPVSDNVYTCVRESYKALSDNNVELIKDIAATFPDSASTEAYVALGDGKIQPFDLFKYNLLNVPIEEKWNLKIKRNYKEEEALYTKLVKNKKYAVVNLKHSRGKLNYKFDFKDGQLIEMNEKYSIFYWLKILENAATIALVESSISNLVEQLNIDNRKILFKKEDNHFMKLPVMKNKWEII